MQQPARLLAHSLFIALFAQLAAPAPAQYGQFDATFGTGGYVLPSVSGEAFGLAVQADGRIVVAGSGSSQVVMMRFLPNGAPDGSFGSNGQLQIPVPPNGAAFQRVCVLGNGDLLAAGNTLVSGFDFQLVLTRRDPQGAPVASFGTNGLALHNEGPGPFLVVDMAIDGNGRIVVCGGGGFAVNLARCLPNGDLDPSFDGDGWVQLNGFQPAGMVVDDQDRVLVCNRNDSKVRIARFLESGAPDLSFGTNGIAEADLLPGGEVESPIAMALTPDGAIIVAGVEGNAQRLFVERHDATGALDATFGTDGRFVLAAPVPCAGGHALVQPDGAIVVGTQHSTTSDAELALLRLSPAGVPDPTWGTGGVSLLQIEDEERIDQMALQPDGRLVMCGQAATPTYYWMLARITTGLPVGVAELPMGPAALTVFPVPARDRCTVLLPKGAGAVRAVELVDAQGRVLPVERFTAMQERLTLLLPEGIAPGAYAVRVQLTGGLRVGRMVVE